MGWGKAGVVAMATVVVLAGSASARQAADPDYAGTWTVAAAPGAPWASGGTLTITRAPSSGAVPANTGQPAWDAYVKGYCLGPPPPGGTAPSVRAWYRLTYTWGGVGSAGGCVSDKTNGQLIFFSSGEFGHVQGRNGNQIFGDWTNNPNGSSRFVATLAEGGSSTAAVAEPAPGASVAVTSPHALPPGATGGVSVTGSAGNTKGTTIVAEGSIAEIAGQLVAECWLVWEPEPEDNLNLNAREKLSWCLAMVKGTLASYMKRHPASVSPAVAASPVSIGAGGCQVQRLVFSARRANGKATAIKPTKASLKATSVRYSCAASGGTVKIKVDGRVKGGLQKQLGPRLDLRVVRNSKAPKRPNKLTFAYSW